MTYHHSYQKSASRHTPLLWLLLPLVGLSFAVASCSGGSSRPRQPTVAVTDTKPVGEGLKVLGYAVLGASVVVVFGRLIPGP
jgi:tellurite resistance protein TehA-like permease